MAHQPAHADKNLRVKLFPGREKGCFSSVHTYIYILSFFAVVSLEKYIHVSAISDIFHVLIFFKSFGFLLFFFFSFRRVFVWTNRYNSEGQLLGRIEELTKSLLVEDRFFSRFLSL